MPDFIGYLALPLILISFASTSLFLRSKRDIIITLGLILIVVSILMFPMFFILKNCVNESVIATDSVVTYISNNKQFKEILQDHRSSSIYLTIVSHAEKWGWDTSSWTIDALKEYLKDFVQIIGTNINVLFGSTYSVVTNISDLIVSLIVFSSCVFYFILYKDSIWKEVEELSPFTTGIMA